jgi:hypothetical protein
MSILLHRSRLRALRGRRRHHGHLSYLRDLSYLRVIKSPQVRTKQVFPVKSGNRPTGVEGCRLPHHLRSSLGWRPRPPSVVKPQSVLPSRAATSMPRIAESRPADARPGWRQDVLRNAAICIWRVGERGKTRQGLHCGFSRCLPLPLLAGAPEIGPTALRRKADSGAFGGVIFSDCPSRQTTPPTFDRPWNGRSPAADESIKLRKQSSRYPQSKTSRPPRG